MAWGTWTGHLVAILATLGVEVAAAALGASRSRTHASSAAAAIPDWKVDAVLAPQEAGLPTLQAADAATAASEEPLLPPTPAEPIGSSKAQDEQRCPLVPLETTMWLLPRESSWNRLSGIWQKRGSDNLIFGAWEQNFFSKSWNDLSVRSSDGRPAITMRPMSDADLKQQFGWEASRSPLEYPNVSRLELPFYDATYRSLTGRAAPVNASVLPATAGRQHVAVLDCEGALLFVVLLQDPMPGEDTYLELAGATKGNQPGGIDVYDRRGDLAAHAIVDLVRPRYQFIDSSGYLLAVAQAPALEMDLAMKDVPRDPTKSNILPYMIQFELGGYANSSRLLEPNFRWVLAAAVQARAIHDIGDIWIKPLPGLLRAMYMGAIVVGVLMVCCLSVCIFQARRTLDSSLICMPNKPGSAAAWAKTV